MNCVEPQNTTNTVESVENKIWIFLKQKYNPNRNPMKEQQQQQQDVVHNATWNDDKMCEFNFIIQNE